MVFKVPALLMLCVLWMTGAVRTRHDNSTKPLQKPPLQLSFSGALQQGTDAMKVTADEEKLMIMMENLLPNTSQLRDRTLVDVGNNARHEQEHFFDERVCFTFDLFPAEQMMGLPRSPRKVFPHLQRLRKWMRLRSGAGGSFLRRDGNATAGNGSEGEMTKEQMNRMLFLGAMSDIFQVPLQFYDMAEATNPGRVKNLTGGTCRPWTVNQSRSVPLGPMVEVLRDSLGPELPLWWATEEDEDINALRQLQSLVAKESTGLVTMAATFEFCVADGSGQLLSTDSLYRVTYQKLEDLEDEDSNESNETRPPSADEVKPGEVVTIFEKKRNSKMLHTPERPKHLILDATEGVTGGCADLTQGSTGEQELDEDLNGEKRLQRINREAAGHWNAGAYDFWNGLKVREVLVSLGTEIGPLKLPLQRAARASFLRASHQSDELPATFDARKQWPTCNSIGLIRNQGRCGSCWAVAAATVMTDRFCVAAQQALKAPHSSLVQQGSNATSRLQDLQGLSLAPELLVQCDEQNHGCSGGRLDDAWIYLKHHGIPKESCAPYKHCPEPLQQSCHYRGWEERPFFPDRSEEKQKDICQGHCTDGSSMSFFRVSEAYAVAKPRDVPTLQRELMLAGPVEVAFFVFSDFMNYRSGVYFRTPGAYGPLGGHAVRLLGWGVEEEFGRKPVDYWLIANSYSPRWGMHGLFKIRRGSNECGIESTPAAGSPDLSLLLAESS